MTEATVYRPYIHDVFRFFSQIPVINDDLPFKILSGSVIVKPNLKEIRGSSVVFDDGSVVENVRTLCLQIFIKSLHLCYILLMISLSVIGGPDCFRHRIQL